MEERRRPIDVDRDERWREWMGAAQKGDSAAYEKLLRELVPHVRRFVQRRVFDGSFVEDVVQNVFVSLHRARHTYRSERRFGPWLHAIARHAVIDHTRARARRANRELPLPDQVAAPAVVSPQPPLSEELERALASLPPAQRQAVELIHVGGLSVAEAADRVGITRSALKVRAHRGYRAMRVRLERDHN